MPTNINGTTGIDQIQDSTVTVNKIAAGAVTEAKLADGAVTAAKLAPGVISTDSVLAATAGASVGAVGTYAWAVTTTTTGVSLEPGQTLAGSGLAYSGGRSTAMSVTTSYVIGSGTWRAVGGISSPANIQIQTLFLRIS
jgi:hypothetical protein